MGGKFIIQNSFCDIRENTSKSYRMGLSPPLWKMSIAFFLLMDSLKYLKHKLCICFFLKIILIFITITAFLFEKAVFFDVDWNFHMANMLCLFWFFQFFPFFFCCKKKTHLVPWKNFAWKSCWVWRCLGFSHVRHFMPVLMASYFHDSCLTQP